MTLPDVPLLADSLDRGDRNAMAQYQQAPWYAKRLVLRLQLAKQAYENEREGIDTSVMVYDMTDKKSVFVHKPEYVHYAASVSKLFVAAVLLDELRAGKTTLDTIVSWDAGDRRDGAGEFDTPTAPTSASVRSVLFDMLNRSGNTAVRVIVNKVLGGAAAVNQRYETDYPQLKVTRLQPVEDDRFLLGYTTPAEADFIFDRLYKGADLYAYIVKDALAKNIFDDYGPRSQIKDRDNITVIDKMGQLNDPEGNNRHDVGVIENAQNGRKLRYVLMTTNYEWPAGEKTDKAVLSLQEFGRDMLRFEGDRLPRPDERGPSEPRDMREDADEGTVRGRTIY